MQTKMMGLIPEDWMIDSDLMMTEMAATEPLAQMLASWGRENDQEQINMIEMANEFDLTNSQNHDTQYKSHYILLIVIVCGKKQGGSRIYS